MCNKSYGSENSLNQHIKIKHIKFWISLKNKEIEEMKNEQVVLDKKKVDEKNKERE